MGLFRNKYPYTDFHELNLDWIIEKMLELDSSFDRFKAVNTITFSGEWDITKQYPSWTIVDSDHNGYLSLRPVPVGIPIDNTTYWVKVANYSVLYAEVQLAIAEMREQIAEITKLRNFVTPEMYGAVGDGVADDTEAIQQALDNGGLILFGQHKTYKVTVPENRGAALKAVNDTIINLNMSTIVIDSNAYAAYQGIALHNVSNVIIQNGSIVGDKDSHTAEGGEWGDCIEMNNTSNIVIRDMTLSKGWGDGIEIYTANGLTVDNVRCIDNRRNGISVISGDDVKIVNCYFNGNGGTNPMNGIDIESNDINDILGNIIIADCVFENTLGNSSININTHKTGSFTVANVICDRAFSFGELGDAAVSRTKVVDSKFNSLSIGLVSALSSFDCDNCNIEKSTARFGLIIGYGIVTNNIHITKLNMFHSDFTFLYSFGTVVNSDIEINTTQTTSVNGEATGFTNTTLKLNNNEITNVDNFFSVDGRLTRLRVAENAPFNSLQYGNIPIGTSIAIEVPGPTGKNFQSVPSTIKLVPIVGQFGEVGTFHGNSYNIVTRVSENILTFAMYY